jgi:hypothetical protein
MAGNEKKPKSELPFIVDKYTGPPPRNTFIDGSGVLANKLSQMISFQNVRDEESVFFKAFIVDFNETYTPNFTPNEVFGRTDPIYQYKNTSRNISLSFKIPAASESEAYENLGRVQKLIQMLYPTYKDMNNALTLSEAPLVRLKVMNLVRNQAAMTTPNKDTASGKGNSQYFAEYISSAEPERGLLGVITTCTVNSMLSSNDGVFNKLSTVQAEPANEETGNPGAPAVTAAEPNTVLPKLIEVSINFAPIHEQTLGYEGQNTKKNALFPYGVTLAPELEEGIKLPPSITERVRKQRTAEDARRRSASRQQEMDSAIAKRDRAKRILDSRFASDGRKVDAYKDRESALSTIRNIGADNALDVVLGNDLETAQKPVDDIGEFLP